MAEPSTTIAGSVAAYTAGQTIALAAHKATFFGSTPEAFILGLVGAFAVCAWLEDFSDKRKTYAGIFLAMLIAGMGSPAAAAAVSQYVPYLTRDLLLYILPLMIGVLVPVIGPSFFRYLKRLLGMQ